MRYSVIIPVYNRPDEVDELLQSLTRQSFKDFEVIVVEDGSSIPCKPVTEKYQELLDVHYYDKPNSGPGQTRNYGAERSKGEYLIILDSDCILPEGYFLAVEEELQHEAADAFGGPDRAHDFWPVCESHCFFPCSLSGHVGCFAGYTDFWLGMESFVPYLYDCSCVCYSVAFGYSYYRRRAGQGIWIYRLFEVVGKTFYSVVFPWYHVSCGNRCGYEYYGS